MGSISGAIGAAASVFGASKSGDAAGEAADAQAEADAASLAFEREKYEDWKDTYGDIETNLSEYYNSLTPEFFAARGLEAFEEEQNVAKDRVRANLAQRGITDSGIAAATELNFASTGARERAKIRATAPSMAAEEQRQFLQVGLGQNPGESLSRALSNNADRAADTASTTGRLAGQATQAAISTVGTALGDYFDGK